MNIIYRHSSIRTIKENSSSRRDRHASGETVSMPHALSQVTSVYTAFYESRSYAGTPLGWPLHACWVSQVQEAGRRPQQPRRFVSGSRLTASI